MSTKKAQLADLMSQVAPKGQPQQNPVGNVLRIEETGTCVQRTDNRDGSRYLLHEYRVVGGDPLARLQFEKDMEANGFDCKNPMDSSELIFKHRDLLDARDVKQIIRNHKGFWAPDERRSLLRRDLIRQGILSEGQIEKELDRRLPLASDEALDNIGE